MTALKSLSSENKANCLFSSIKKNRLSPAVKQRQSIIIIKRSIGILLCKLASISFIIALKVIISLSPFGLLQCYLIESACCECEIISAELFDMNGIEFKLLFFNLRKININFK